MITVNLHFQCGFACEVASQDLSSVFGLVVKYKGTDITLFFPTATARDAVRDALLQCPGCVARAEAAAVEPSKANEPTAPTIEGVPITPHGVDRFVANERAFNGMVANAVFGTPLPQPAVQAMEGQEGDWF